MLPMAPEFLLPQSIFWHLVTRFGESQILLPAALATMFWLARRTPARPLVRWWLLGFALAFALTTASKIAFIGWGVSIPPINFTGVSGHAMCAAAIYPVLLRTLTSTRQRGWQIAALGAGYALALLVAVSRVMVHAHSWSEVASGFALGGAASAAALLLARMPRTRLPVWLPLALVVWLVTLSAVAPRSRTHDAVTWLALKVSGRPAPYTRAEMQREYRLRLLRTVADTP
jgi:membrane-associated phospholipid phosphatase